MSDLSGTRRRTLLNVAEIRALQKMPTVANGSPGVVFGGRPINWHGVVWHVFILIESFLRNVASELLVQVFGERGIHARSAVSVAQVPFGACVEIDMIAELTATQVGGSI